LRLGWTPGVGLGVCGATLCIALAVPAAAADPDPGAAGEAPADTGAGGTLTLLELQNIRLSASSFFEVSRQSAPGTTYVIDRQKIATSPSRTLADTVEMSVPGMHLARHLWTGAVIGVRGITIDNNAKTMVMLDGLNLNMRTHFGTHGLLSLPLLEDVESMEVSNGPGSLVHGSGAINGYINLLPKDGAAHPGLEATIEVGPVESHGSAQVSYGFTYGRSNNLYLYAGFAGAAGFSPRVDLPWSCTGPFDNESLLCPYRWIKARDMGPSYKLSANWNHGNLEVVALFARVLQSTEGNALTDWFYFEDPYWMSTILGVRPQYTLSFGDTEDLVISASAGWQDYGFIPRHPPGPSMGGDMMVGWNHPPRVGRERAGSLRALLKTLRLPLNSLALGFDLGHRRFDRGQQFFGGGGERLGFEDADFNWLELASFVEDTFTFRGLSLTGGLRFEYFKNPRRFQPDTYTEADTRETVIPSPVSLDDHRALVGRFGAALSLTPDTTVRASYQRGFRNPDASYYTHWAARDAIEKRKGQPGLPPLDNETMDSFELNLGHTVSPVLLTYVNSYYNRYEKLLAWIDEWNAFRNDQDHVQSVGGELGGELAAGGLRISGAYGYTRPLGYGTATYAQLALTNADRTSWKVYSPHQVKASVTGSFLDDRLSATLAGAIFSKVDDPAWAAGRGHRVLVNGAVRYQLTPPIYLKLVLQNLTGNSVPAARINNRFTQVGNLGIEQRLVYLSLGLRLP
jgi:outer membrane receptor protein involved in Fe transport